QKARRCRDPALEAAAGREVPVRDDEQAQHDSRSDERETDRAYRFAAYFVPGTLPLVARLAQQQRHGHYGREEDELLAERVEAEHEDLAQRIARRHVREPAQADDRDRVELQGDHPRRLRAARAVACAATGLTRNKATAMTSALMLGCVQSSSTRTAAATRSGGTADAAMA